MFYSGATPTPIMDCLNFENYPISSLLRDGQYWKLLPAKAEAVCLSTAVATELLWLGTQRKLRHHDVVESFYFPLIQTKYELSGWEIG